ncbi:MAG: DNA methylase N-4 [Kaistia sp. SCN 65-12]|nr:MAG: DNA methylase N-4 [Kaistia sp. SCN 65-12]
MLADRIEHIPIDHIKPYGANPREHDDRQISKLVGIIRMVGFLVPVIIDDANIIIAGHGRWAAAKQLDLQSIPAIRAGHLTAAQIKAFRLADNRVGELSTWNKTALALELKALVEAIDLDPELLELTAFEIAEIDLHIESLDEQASAPDRADLRPDPGPAVTRTGDIWSLGRHRLLCGSALERESYRLLLEGHRVRSVWSDPPYNVAVSGHVCGLGQVQHREFAMASGEMNENEFTAFLATYLALAKEHSLPGSLHYVCMDGPHAFELLSAARKVQLPFKVTCTWAKTNAGMGSFYRHQTEFVHVFKNGGDEVAHVNNIQLGKYGRYRTTLWTYPGVNTFRKGRMDDLQAHPTMKPWALVADAIKDCTGLGDSVLDCFCGSGTTLIAAEKTRRIGYGIEVDPVYVDVTVRRWEALTGKQAIHAQTGQSFAAVQAERAIVANKVEAAHV